MLGGDKHEIGSRQLKENALASVDVIVTQLLLLYFVCNHLFDCELYRIHCTYKPNRPDEIIEKFTGYGIYSTIHSGGSTYKISSATGPNSFVFSTAVSQRCLCNR